MQIVIYIRIVTYKVERVPPTYDTSTQTCIESVPILK